jgi:UDPglucose 6-dehydrogenase
MRFQGDSDLRLSVIGCGYVGLVTGACFAAAGHEVTCTDIDAERIRRLQAGEVPIYEHHLEEILTSAGKAGRISYTADAGEAIRAAMRFLFAWHAAERKR